MDEVENAADRSQEASSGPAPRSIPAESIPESRLDQDALRVVSRLQRHGFEAYFVGGCVRDLLIGRIPKDFDVATSAHPRQIRRLFRNARIIGRRFRLAHITYGDHVVETATFRREPDEAPAEDTEVDVASDVTGDDPAAGPADDLLITQDNVFGTAEQDAQRRDFSINALFLDPTQNVILDYVGGLDDLEAGLRLGRRIDRDEIVRSIVAQVERFKDLARS